MLAAQGLEGPRVEAIPLATEIDGHDKPARSRAPGERPLVVIPARLEAHKNVLTAVQAAHRLWQEGLEFELVLLGGAGVGQELVFDAVKAIQEEGHPIRRLGWVSDEVMWQTFTDAAFIVFISLHEGYGLPLVEAMSCGAPVLTSNFGSQAEIAADRGVPHGGPEKPDVGRRRDAGAHHPSRAAGRAGSADTRATGPQLGRVRRRRVGLRRPRADGGDGMKGPLRDRAQVAWSARYALLARCLGPAPTRRRRRRAITAHDVGARVHGLLDAGDRSHVWLALSVMTGRLPDEPHLEAVAMASEFDAGEALRDAIVAEARPGRPASVRSPCRRRTTCCSTSRRPCRCRT